MRSVQGVQRRTWYALGSLLVLLVFVLAACGANTGGSTNTGSGSTTGTTPTTTSASAYGCPSTVVTAATAPAQVVVKPANSHSIVTAHVGDVVEFDMPFGQAWSGPTTSQGGLQLQTPVGYAVTSSKACVWRFTAQGTGTTQVDFFGKAICHQGQLFPQYIMRMSYTIENK